MYEGNVYDFNGRITGYVDGTIGESAFEGEVVGLALEGFTGYVEAETSVDLSTDDTLISGRGATVDPHANPRDLDVTDEGDAYLEDDDEGDDDDAPDGYLSYRMPVQFGDDNVSILVDATWPSREAYDQLQNRVKNALTARGVPTLDTRPGDEVHAEQTERSLRGGVARSITHPGVQMGDPRLREALAITIEALTAPDVTIHSVRTTDADGRDVAAPQIRAALGVADHLF